MLVDMWCVVSTLVTLCAHVCVCALACMHVLVYVHVVYMCVHACVYMCVHARVYVCICVYMHVCMCVYVCTCMCVYVYVRAWMCVCVDACIIYWYMLLGLSCDVDSHRHMFMCVGVCVHVSYSLIP